MANLGLVVRRKVPSHSAIQSELAGDKGPWATYVFSIAFGNGCREIFDGLTLLMGKVSCR
jgi:hypothetical protein